MIGKRKHKCKPPELKIYFHVTKSNRRWVYAYQSENAQRYFLFVHGIPMHDNVRHRIVKDFEARRSVKPIVEVSYPYLCSSYNPYVRRIIRKSLWRYEWRRNMSMRDFKAYRASYGTLRAARGGKINKAKLWYNAD